MLYPAFNEVQELLKEYDVVPVFHEVLSDSMTPIHIFNALKGQSETCFILESVDNTQWGRYSFIGIQPKMEIRIKNGKASVCEEGRETSTRIDNPIAFLTDILNRYKSPSFPNRPKLTGGLVGYFGYDTVRYMEKKLIHPPKDDLDLPDCHLFLYDRLVAFDHLSNKTVVIQNISRGGDAAQQYAACEAEAKRLGAYLKAFVPQPRAAKKRPAPVVETNITREQHMENIRKAQEYIRDGDIFQVVLSRRLEVPNPPDAFDVYRCLRSANPSPYLYYFKLKDYEIVGASPEMLVNVTKGIVSTKPIAGTSKRGLTEAQDKEFERDLLKDPKEKSEHTMLVDLGRNDVGKVSKFGAVEVTSFMKVERYSQVMHIVSDVKGMLRDDKTALDALLSVLPAGTLSGAPKVRAMEIIDELEPNKRGLYGGTVGYLAFDGNIDTCIAIRTVLFKNNRAYVQAGGGIVADSVPEKEFEESENKARAVINAIEQACNL